MPPRILSSLLYVRGRTIAFLFLAQYNTNLLYFPTFIRQVAFSSFFLTSIHSITIDS